MATYVGFIGIAQKKLLASLTFSCLSKEVSVQVVQTGCEFSSTSALCKFDPETYRPVFRENLPYLSLDNSVLSFSPLMGFCDLVSTAICCPSYHQ